MSPRKRESKNSQLAGTNIKKNVKCGKSYFYYLMPDGSYEPLLHGDEKGSIEAAIALNQELRPSGSVVSRIMNAPTPPSVRNPKMVDVIEQFRAEWLLKQGYAKRTLARRNQMLEQYKNEWPAELVGDIDTFAVAQFLRKFGTESARLHRILLDFLFRFVASEGYSTSRPMLDVERRKAERRKRARHTWEGHLAICEASPDWLKRAINIALLSLQRRSDLVGINIREQINIEKRTIRILQQKTRNYENPIYIDIGMGDELFEVVMAAIRSPIACPFLIHYQPRTRRRAALDAKPHPFAVLEDYLSKEYAKVRDAVGIYNHLPPKQRPGLHSLRALGIWMYYKAGYEEDYIMALAGHANKKMTQHYEQGHERQKPVQVQAGLCVKDVDFKSIDWETGLSKPLKKLADED